MTRPLVVPGVRSLLTIAQRTLEGTVDSPSLDAETLLSHVLGLSRSEMFLGTHEVSGRQRAEFAGLVDRRAAGEPLQYITGVAAFRRLTLQVGLGVLVPRPETEMLVEFALQKISGTTAPSVLDVGTGSGAIALSIATERPDAAVVATEISADAIAWAGRNAEALGVSNIELLEGDLFEPLDPRLRGTLPLIVSNPPYLSDGELEGLPIDVKFHEPQVALTSGPTGLEVPARVLEGAIDWLAPDGWLVMETTPTKAEDLRRILAAFYDQVSILDDLNGDARVAMGKRR